MTEQERQRLLTLADLYCSENIDSEQLVELQEILRRRGDVSARLFVRYLQMHANLDEALQAAGAHREIDFSQITSEDELPSLPPMPKSGDKSQTESRPTPRKKETRIAGRSPTVVLSMVSLVSVSLAAAIVIAISWIHRLQTDIAGTNRINDWWVTVMVVENATFELNIWKLEAGQRLKPNSTVFLKRGVVWLRFPTGVKVSLKGPARFQLTSENSGELSFGLLTADVPPEGVGFSVSTPRTNIVDLGTQFAVSVSSEGDEEVVVLQGEVSVTNIPAKNQAEETIHLTSGQHIRRQRNSDTYEQAESISSKLSDISHHVFAGQQSVVAYSTKTGLPGNHHENQGPLGHDFVVNQPIFVTQLGAFDSDTDGFQGTIITDIWSRDDNGTPDDPDDDTCREVVATMTFSADSPGQLIESNRMKPLAEPVFLKPGAYTVASRGFSDADPAGNTSAGWLTPARFAASRFVKSMNDGNGALSFVGRGRFLHIEDASLDKRTQPDDTHDAGRSPVDPYSGPTFVFQAVK